MQRRLIAFVLTWLATCSSSADPARRKPVLNWTRSDEAQGCVDSRALATRIEALTGPVFVEPVAADYAIEGHIERVAVGGFVVRIAVANRAGERSGERILEQRGSDCRTFDDAIAFVIALTIDPRLELGRVLLPDNDLGQQSPEQVLLSELQEEPPHLTPRTQSDDPEPVTRRTAPSTDGGLPDSFVRHLSAGASTTVSFRELPESSAGMTLFGRWQPQAPLSLALQLRGLWTMRDSDLPTAGSLRAHAFGAGLLLCTGAGSALLDVQACVGPEPLWARARGIGLREERTGELLLWAALARIELAFRLDDHWSVLLEGQLRVSPQDKRFVYSDVVRNEAAYHFAHYGGSSGVGVRYAFVSARAHVSERAARERGADGR